jgi:arsenate reductase (thioredoxin)
VQSKFKVIILCTGNSARSILGEYLLKKLGKDRFEVFSAGSKPKGEVHPLALRTLKEVYQIDANDARSKSLDVLKDIHFDFVITVCDNAREACPVWPGNPITAHWGVNDPADFTGSEEEHLMLFKGVAATINRRIDLFCSLPFEKLDHLRLTHATREIGQKS